MKEINDVEYKKYSMREQCKQVWDCTYLNALLSKWPNAYQEERASHRAN